MKADVTVLKADVTVVTVDVTQNPNSPTASENVPDAFFRVSAPPGGPARRRPPIAMIGGRHPG
ncbi:hypothetical protein Vgi01_53590 [Micromonospora gifhornensis]|uniref:Uncharacterized protein n=1 Tax=Micromonospora gifhornensis TaxID=84594 RepID=A0ABQ4IL80_9ACTN|nr:hypothetical protein Vgi01_53590 [Micromonospora gifhornensis]